MNEELFGFFEKLFEFVNGAGGFRCERRKEAIRALTVLSPINKGLKPARPLCTGCDKPATLASGTERKGKIGPTLYLVNIEIERHLLSFSLNCHIRAQETHGFILLPNGRVKHYVNKEGKFSEGVLKTVLYMYQTFSVIDIT